MVKHSRIFPPQYDALPLAFHGDDFAAQGFIKKLKPMFPGFRGFDLFHQRTTYN